MTTGRQAPLAARPNHWCQLPMTAPLLVCRLQVLRTPHRKPKYIGLMVVMIHGRSGIWRHSAQSCLSMVLSAAFGVLCAGSGAPQRPGQKAIKVQLGKGGLPPHLQTPGSGNATPATSTGGMSIRKQCASVCFVSSAAMCLFFVTLTEVHRVTCCVCTTPAGDYSGYEDAPMSEAGDDGAEDDVVRFTLLQSVNPCPYAAGASCGAAEADRLQVIQTDQPCAIVVIHWMCRRMTTTTRQRRRMTRA